MEDDEYEPQLRYERPNADHISQLMPKKRRRRWPIYLVILFIIVAGGAGALYLKDKQQTAKSSASKTVSTPKAAVGQKITLQDSNKTFSSDTLKLSIKYPDGWATNESAGKATISSPNLLLLGDDGEQITGQIVVTLQPKQGSLLAFSKGGSLAARDSEKLSYKYPSSVQRGQTYLSFLHYAGSTTSDTVMYGMYITGDSGYTIGQNIPQADVVKGDPLVSISFYACDDNNCSNPKTLGIAAANWDDPAFSGTIRNILTSLVIY